MNNHAIQRLQEHYGVEAVLADLMTMRDAILAGAALLIAKQPDNRAIYLVKHRDKPIRTVADQTTGEIVTVLPLSATLPRRRRTPWRELPSVQIALTSNPRLF